MMKHQPTKTPTVLAIEPYTRGFGYAVFHDPQHLLDFGVTDLKLGRVSRSLERIAKLMFHYEPTVVVIKTPVDKKTDKTLAQDMVDIFAKHCAAVSIPFKRYTREQIQAFFRPFGAVTREEIANELIEWLPELGSHRPKKRAVWDSEDRNMRLFSAVSVALTFYAEHEDEQNKLIQQ